MVLRRIGHLMCTDFTNKPNNHVRCRLYLSLPQVVQQKEEGMLATREELDRLAPLFWPELSIPASSGSGSASSVGPDVLGGNVAGVPPDVHARMLELHRQCPHLQWSNDLGRSSARAMRTSFSLA